MWQEITHSNNGITTIKKKGGPLKKNHRTNQLSASHSGPEGGIGIPMP